MGSAWRAALGLTLGIVQGCSSGVPPKTQATSTETASAQETQTPASSAPPASEPPAPAEGGSQASTASASVAVPHADAKAADAKTSEELTAAYDEAVKANPVLFQALLGAARQTTDAPLDHPLGKPLRGVCSLDGVRFEEKPELFGLEGFVAVKDRAEAKKLGARSYAFLKTQLIDMNKDKQPDLAFVSVMNWGPRKEGGMAEWGEIYVLASKNCSVGSVVVVKSGPKACKPASECCKVCDADKACGDTCIRAGQKCHKHSGCACNASDVCG